MSTAERLAALGTHISEEAIREAGGMWDCDDAVWVFPDGSSGTGQNIANGALYPDAWWLEVVEDDEEES